MLVKGYVPRTPIKTLEVPVLGAYDNLQRGMAPAPRDGDMELVFDDDDDTPSPRSVIVLDLDDDLGPFPGEDAPVFQPEHGLEIGQIVVHNKLYYEVTSSCEGGARWTLSSSYPVQTLVVSTEELLAMPRAPVLCHVTVENETVKQVARQHNILPGDLVRANRHLVGITQNCKFYAHTILHLPP